MSKPDEQVRIIEADAHADVDRLRAWQALIVEVGALALLAFLAWSRVLAADAIVGLFGAWLGGRAAQMGAVARGGGGPRSIPPVGPVSGVAMMLMDRARGGG